MKAAKDHPNLTAIRYVSHVGKASARTAKERRIGARHGTVSGVPETERENKKDLGQKREERGEDDLERRRNLTKLPQTDGGQAGRLRGFREQDTQGGW